MYDLLYSQLVEAITSGPVVAFEIRGENAQKKWLDILGPNDPARARASASSTIRARFGAGNAKYWILFKVLF